MGVWSYVISVVFGLLTVIYVPSILMLRILNIRGFALLGIAPVWSAGVATVASILFHTLDIFWNLTNYLVFNLIAILFLGLIRIIIFSKENSENYLSHPDRELFSRKKEALLTLAFIIGGSLFFWLPTMWGIDLHLPAQQNDSTFHMSALMTMVQTGNASPMSAFSSLYGLAEANVTYPAVWHQLAALFATESTVVFVSKSMQLVTAIVWSVNIAIFASVVLIRANGAGFVAVAVAQLIPIFPVYYHVQIPLWPNAWGVALLPGLVAGILSAYRNIREGVKYSV